MNDITKHLGDERRLKLTTEKIKEFISKSTPVVNWYSHTEDSTVRGPFGRWFTASGDDKHLANIRDDVEYCAIAMTVLPDLVNQLEQLKQQLKLLEEENKSHWDIRYDQALKLATFSDQLAEAVEVIEKAKFSSGFFIDDHNSKNTYLLASEFLAKYKSLENNVTEN